MKAHLGEMGIGSDHDGWFTALNLSLAVVAREGWEMTYWVAGTHHRHTDTKLMNQRTLQLPFTQF